MELFLENLLACSIQICWSGTPRSVSSLESLISYFEVFSEIVLYGILANNRQILFDSFDDSSKHGLHKVIGVRVRNWKTFHLPCIFYQHDFVMLCVFTQLSLHKILIFRILFSSFLTTSCCFSIYILKVKFSLLQIKMKDQIWSH